MYTPNLILLILGVLQMIQLKNFARNSKGSVRPVISLPVAYTAMLSNATIHGQIAIQS